MSVSSLRSLLHAVTGHYWPVILGCVIVAATLTLILLHTMDFSFITNKIAEAQQAVANAFARTAKAEQTALAGQPTSDQLTAAANSLQAIIDAANGVAPNVTLP